MWGICWTVMNKNNEDVQINLIFATSIFIISLGLFFLGRWLGRQEDIAE